MRTTKRPALAFVAASALACARFAGAADDGAAPPWRPCIRDIAEVIAPKPAASPAKLPAAQVAKLDAAVKASLPEAAAPGVVVGVRSPKGTWIAAYGVADTASNAPMTADVHQRIGSVTKTFIGTILLQLADEKKLSLDDSIAKYVPGVPNGSGITLRFLADMRSGLVSYTESAAFTDDFFGHPEKVFQPDELIAIGLAARPKFPPGSEFNYSNTNTLLLGKVIEKVTGEPIAEVLRKRTYVPLGLKGTSFPNDSAILPAPHARGYTLQGPIATAEKPVDATDWNPSWAWTAGGMISTIGDLLVYARALGTGQGLLSPAAQTRRLVSFEPPGYGIGLGCIDGWVGHSGELPGFNTTLFYDTTTDTAVVVEANSDIASGGCTESETLSDDQSDAPCADPAARVFVALSTALGHVFTPPPKR